MNRVKQKIIVMGLGYIGLPTASVLATKGHQVVGVDVNAITVQTIIAVPTPFKQIGANPKAPDLSYVEAAARAIPPYLRAGNLIILESTSPLVPQS